MKWKRWNLVAPTRAEASKYGRVFVVDPSDDYTGVRKWNEPLPDRDLYWSSFTEQREEIKRESDTSVPVLGPRPVDVEPF